MSGGLAGIVQARMSSSRMPGKVLKEVRGRTLLEYLIERLALSKKMKRFVIATSSDASDDAIERFCQDRGIECRRGSLLNVAQRFLKITEALELDAFVRINADSPALDPALIDEAVLLFESGPYDLVSNTLLRSYPRGQSVEVVRARTFCAVYPEFSDTSHFEHVTRYFYEHAADFRIASFKNPYGDDSSVNLSIDTPEDLQRFERALGRIQVPFAACGWRDFLRAAA